MIQGQGTPRGPKLSHTPVSLRLFTRTLTKSTTYVSIIHFKINVIYWSLNMPLQNKSKYDWYNWDLFSKQNTCTWKKKATKWSMCMSKKKRKLSHTQLCALVYSHELWLWAQYVFPLLFKNKWNLCIFKHAIDNQK